MRILIVMDGFFPGKKYGGPPVSVDNFATLMDGLHECYIVTRNHELGATSRYEDIHEGWNDRGNAKVMYLSDSEYGYGRIKAIAGELAPDVLYLQSLFQRCVMPCLRLAHCQGMKVVLAPRGELCAGAFRKKYKKLPYIALLRMAGWTRDVEYQSTSQEESEAIANYMGASPERIHLLPNVPTVGGKVYAHPLKHAGRARFIFLSRIHWKKNLLQAIRLFQNVQGQVVFDIYGPREDEEYWQKCRHAIDELPQNVEVNYRGEVEHDDVHSTFACYDAFLFPTLSENYGHVIVEALMAGCLPVISDRTPWSAFPAGAGWSLPLDDEQGFIQAVQAVVGMDAAQMETCRKSICRYLRDHINLEKIREEYLQVFA